MTHPQLGTLMPFKKGEESIPSGEGRVRWRGADLKRPSPGLRPASPGAGEAKIHARSASLAASCPQALPTCSLLPPAGEGLGNEGSIWRGAKLKPPSPGQAAGLSRGGRGEELLSVRLNLPR